MLTRLPWYVAGPMIGLLIVGLRAAANKPFGALGGYIDLAENAWTPRKLGFRAYVLLGLLLGLLLGGTAYALLSGTLDLSFVYGTAGGLPPEALPAQIAILVGGGVAIGYGARTAGGCTSGHGMSGVSLASPASLVATITFFVTAVLVANILAFAIGGTP